MVLVAASASRDAQAQADALAGRVVEDPSRPPRVTGATAEGGTAADRRVLFLAFDGVDVQWCGETEDDPHDNCSSLFQGAVLPYKGGAAERAAVVQTVVADLADFDVIVTTERPPQDVDYDMEAIGQWSPPAGGFLGIAPKIDCFDVDGGDLSFTLDPEDMLPSDTAKVVLQELAHTWGLEHVDSTGDLLFPTVGNAPDPHFEDQCSPIVYTPNLCPRQHAEFCPEGEQNSYQEMLMLFGPRQPDEVAPVVSIVSPSDGAHVPNSFSLVLELHDDIAPQVFATNITFVDGFESAVDLAGPGVFPVALNDVPDGVWTIDVATRDVAGNEGSASITITVGAGEPAAEDESGSGTTDTPATTTGDADGSGDADSSDGDSSDGGGALDDDGGCACGVGLSPAGWHWLMLLAPLRRRASRRSRRS